MKVGTVKVNSLHLLYNYTIKILICPDDIHVIQTLARLNFFSEKLKWQKSHVLSFSVLFRVLSQ